MEPDGSQENSAEMDCANNGGKRKIQVEPEIINPSQGKKQKTLPDIRYTVNDEAPYRIYVETRSNDKEDAKINKFSLGKLLSQMEEQKGHILDMKYVGRTKVMIINNNFAKANQLVEKLNEEKSPLMAYVPRHLVSMSGVIAGIPESITEEEILMGLECEYPVTDVRRLFRYEGKDRVSFRRVSVTFRSKCLPERVKLFFCIVNVFPFRRKVEQCGRCLRFGHKTANCKGAIRSYRCGDRHEEEQNCQKPIKCVHCKSNEHISTAETCPERQQQIKINNMRAKQNLTYIEARLLCPLSNRFDLLENTEEFPPIANSYSNIVGTSSPLREQWKKRM